MSINLGNYIKHTELEFIYSNENVSRRILNSSKDLFWPKMPTTPVSVHSYGLFHGISSNMVPAA